MRTMKTLLIFVAALMMLKACGTTQPVVIDRESQSLIEFCTAWKRSLATRSEDDTQQTQDEVGETYTAYDAQCADITGRADP